MNNIFTINQFTLRMVLGWPFARAQLRGGGTSKILLKFNPRMSPIAKLYGTTMEGGVNCKLVNK